tara:strand:- start:8938 stop:9606 length:669 start_codon:yes stop_codon:yes gene_type:complete
MEIEPVGFIESPFQEKFGAPRQPGLVNAAEGRILFVDPWNREEAIRGLEAFSQIWVIYGFHQISEPGSRKTTARPPRLGGNERVGIFASRSPFRPNRLGLSLVELLAVEPGLLRIGGLDMVDGSPVYDVKPYLPWAESIPEAKAGFAAERPGSNWEVEFETGVPNQNLRELIAATLALDPRPAFHKPDSHRVYGAKLSGYNVRWRVDEIMGVVKVIEILEEK